MSLRPGAVDFKEKWGSLQKTIIAVVRLNPVSTATWNDHYSDIYALCEAFPKSYAETLYQETQNLLIQFVTDLLESLKVQRSLLLLTSYREHWLCYHRGSQYLDNLFSYFNRVPLRKYQLQQEGFFPPITGIAEPPRDTHPDKDTPIQIRLMALKVWKEKLLDHLKQLLVSALLEEIQRERNGESADLGMVGNVVASFVEVGEVKPEGRLQYYQEFFEAPFLLDTGLYYRQEGSRMVTDLSCPEYMKQVVCQLQAARRSGTRFLHQTSITKFIRECEARLVMDYRENYLYAHTRDMIRQENTADLSNLFFLLNGIPKALQPVVYEFEQHVKEQGALALGQLYQDKTYGVIDFVGAVLSIHSKYNSMVTTLFSSNKEFSAALDRACKSFVNICEAPGQHPKAPMLLARYCDQLLRKPCKGLGEGEIEDRLHDAITVFRYLEEKDIFQRFYSRMLSRRLVQGLSISMEAEESMIHRLKHACGYEYTSRLQRMVVDVRLSADVVTEFQEHLAAGGDSLPISFSTMVLQSATWPLHPSASSVFIPPLLQSAISKFEEFYTSKHSGRTLSWLHSLSLAELRMTYLKKLYTVCVTTHQMALLLAYNDSEVFSVSSLEAFTQLPKHELSNTLHSLLDSKLVLRQQGEGPTELTPQTMIKLNKNYSNKRTKFKVIAASQKDTQQDIEQTRYNVAEDRKIYIQAAIVRVMKARKTLQHNQLIQEAISHVRSRFTPNIQTIKRCIETLMEKQYLERQDGARDTYSYVA